MAPTITRDVQAAWRKFKQHDDQDARLFLIEHYAYLARVGAGRVNVPPTVMFSQEDLVGQAVIGLIDAIEKFNPDMGRPFEAYALLRIKGAILDALRAADWLPRITRQNESRLREVMARYEMTYGRSATDEELCRELQVDEDRLEELFAATNASAIQSLEDLLSFSDDLKTNPVSANNSFNNPADLAENAQVERLLQKAIDDLAENEKTVIALYYFEEMTLKEIGKALGVTESRACQLHTKAILKLQTKLKCWMDVMYLAS